MDAPLPFAGRVARNSSRGEMPRSAVEFRDRTRPPGGSALELNRLDLEELLEAITAVFPAMPRLLEAAKWSKWIERRSVDLDLPRTHSTSEGFRTLGVGRPDAAVQTVDRAVGDLGRLVLGVVRDDREHWAEDLLLGDRHVGLHLGKDRRADEVAALEPLWRLGAAGDELRALLLSLLDEASDALALRLRHQGAEARAVLERVTRHRLL